jgi:hypothetical protein
MIGGVSTFKKIRVKHVKSGIILVFLDAKNFIAGGSLADCVKNFGDGKESKSMMAYEAFDITNYESILNSTEPFTKEQFRSILRKTHITEKDYQQYLKYWDRFKKECSTFRLMSVHPLIDKFLEGKTGIDMTCGDDHKKFLKVRKEAAKQWFNILNT